MMALHYRQALAILGALASLVTAQSSDPLAECTQTDLDLLDQCVASQIDGFLSTYEDGFTATTFDYSSVVSQINSLQSDLTSFGITLTSFLPDPASFTGFPTTVNGPYVSDIINSYSQFTATRTETTGEGFSFNTESFRATATSSSDSSSSTIPTVTSGVTTSESSSSFSSSSASSRSPSSSSASSSSFTSSSASSSRITSSPGMVTTTTSSVNPNGATEPATTTSTGRAVPPATIPPVAGLGLMLAALFEL